MYQDTYFVDKSSGTFSDALMAFGAADVIRRLTEDREVRIEDAGSAYQIRCNQPLSESFVKDVHPFVCQPFILTPKNKAQIPNSALEKMPNSMIVVDYESEKQQRAEFFERRKELSKEAQIALALGKSHPAADSLSKPHPDYAVFSAVNSPSSLTAYNNLIAAWWRGYESMFPEMIQSLLQMFIQSPNDIDGAEVAWTELCKVKGLPKPSKSTFIQILNPAQGKGQNRSKADKIEMKNIEGFWLPEYLKTVGLYQGAITRIVANPKDPRNAKDRKTYVLAPSSLDWGAHDKVMRDFKQAMAGSETAIRLDVLVALRYTQAFLDHFEDARIKSPKRELFKRRVSDFVSGTQTAYYKNLGNAAAVMNISTLNLPEWVVYDTPEDLHIFKEVLTEIERIVRGLDESHSGEDDMLNDFRTFFTGGDWDKFFRFTTAYSSFIVKQRERNKLVKQFTTTNLEAMMRNSRNDDFTGVLNSPGFQNVAAAIRNATVDAQYYKTKDVKPRYEVKYGLGQELARQANYPANFIEALGDFLFEYSREKAQMQERYKDLLKQRKVPSLYRPAIETLDIEEILQLVKVYTAPVVCKLLIAYGYARTPRDKSDPSIGDTTLTELSDEADTTDTDLTE